jgi:hypothetical protein
MNDKLKFIETKSSDISSSINDLLKNKLNLSWKDILDKYRAFLVQYSQLDNILEKKDFLDMKYTTLFPKIGFEENGLYSKNFY